MSESWSLYESTDFLSGFRPSTMMLSKRYPDEIKSQSSTLFRFLQNLMKWEIRKYLWMLILSWGSRMWNEVRYCPTSKKSTKNSHLSPIQVSISSRMRNILNIGNTFPSQRVRCTKILSRFLNILNHSDGITTSFRTGRNQDLRVDTTVGIGIMLKSVVFDSLHRAFWTESVLPMQADFKRIIEVKKNLSKHCLTHKSISKKWCFDCVRMDGLYQFEPIKSWVKKWMNWSTLVGLKFVMGRFFSQKLEFSSSTL